MSSLRTTRVAMNKGRLLPLVFIAGVFSYTAQAQQPANPLDFVNAQLVEQMKNQVRAMSDPELIQAQARLQRKYYDALIEAGFSKDEALKIVIATAQSNK